MIIVNPTSKCKYLSQKTKIIEKETVRKEIEDDEFENKLRKEIERMSEIKVLGANIPRANPKVIQNLIDMGVLYVGEDNQLHAVDAKENISTPTAKKE